MSIQIKNYLQAKTNLVSFKHICSMKIFIITFSNGNNGDKTTPDSTSKSFRHHLRNTWNNPVYYTDPNGRCSLCLIAGVIVVDP